MKTVSAVIKNGQIALSEPVHWPEGTEVRVRRAGSPDQWEDESDTLGTTLRHLSAIFRDLIELRNGPECDEYGVLRPTKHAFDVASQLLIDAARAAAAEERQIPLGHAS